MTTTILLNKFQRLTNKREEKDNGTHPMVFGRKVGLLTKLFGCSHEDMGRPFTHGKATYRSCLHCGARKPFNLDTFETQGYFYFPPVLKD